MKLLAYVTFILLIANVFFAITVYEEKNRPLALTHAALEPVLHIFNSKLYLQEDDHRRSREELSVAISKIHKLQANLSDTQSRELLETTLTDLEMLNKVGLKESEVNDPYVKMLLALSYLQVKQALLCSSHGQQDDMIISVRRAMYIVRQALILSEGSKRDYEVDIYADMYEIANRRVQHPEVIRKTLSNTLREIESLNISFDS